MTATRTDMLDNTWLARRTNALRQASRMQGAALKAVRTSPVVPGQGVVLCAVRDERPLLPHFLRHYRNIGVRRFAFVDNGSRDETRAFLLEQPDCDVYEDAGDFRAAQFGMAWKNHLLSVYAGAAWHLAVDADEHAVYTGWPATGLDEFAARLGAMGRGAATAILVDMYGAGPIAEARTDATRDLLEVCPYFDGDGYRISIPRDWRRERFPRLDVRGGPMSRLQDGGDRGWHAKTPLLLEPNVLFTDPHTVIPVTLNFARPTMALLHFRFTALLAQRLAHLDARGYTRGSSESYRRIAENLRENPAFTLHYPGSVRFGSFEQILDRCTLPAMLR